MYNDSAKQATIKYMREKRDKLTLNLPLGGKTRYKKHAETRGMSLTALIIDLLERDIGSDGNGSDDGSNN